MARTHTTARQGRAERASQHTHILPCIMAIADRVAINIRESRARAHVSRHSSNMYTLSLKIVLNTHSFVVIECARIDRRSPFIVDCAALCNHRRSSRSQHTRESSARTRESTWLVHARPRDKGVQNERASTLTCCRAESPSPIESQPTHERIERAHT